MTSDTPSPSLQGLTPLSQQIRAAQGGQQGGMNPQWDKWLDMVKAAGVTGFSGPKMAAVPPETPNSGLVSPGVNDPTTQGPFGNYQNPAAMPATSTTPTGTMSLDGLMGAPVNKRNGSLVGGR